MYAPYSSHPTHTLTLPTHLTPLTPSHPHRLSVPDQTPNLGLFWYFFTETFEHFRIFFLCVFQMNAFIYVIPLTIRFR